MTHKDVRIFARSGKLNSTGPSRAAFGNADRHLPGWYWWRMQTKPTASLRVPELMMTSAMLRRARQICSSQEPVAEGRILRSKLNPFPLGILCFPGSLFSIMEGENVKEKVQRATWIRSSSGMVAQSVRLLVPRELATHARRKFFNASLCRHP